MMVFHGCSKCHGDLYVEPDFSDIDLVCLQCGYRKTVRSSGYSQMMAAANRADRELVTANN